MVDRKVGLRAIAAMAVTVFTGTLVQAQDSLPFPPRKSGSTAGPTMQSSVYKPLPQPQRLPGDAPNVLIIMLDDVGPALPDTYGGDIHTPTLTRISKSGISYNRFHNAAMCSPTRAALLTGRNHHRVGFGQIAELANDWDGYSGRIPPTTASAAKVLGYYGYKTAAFGKWHNTPAEETTQQGPFDLWPTGRLVGFDYFYGFLAGESSQWEPAVVENTVRLPAPHRKDYHFTEDMTEKALKWMRQHQAVSPKEPFFIYWAPGASHGPHHIFKEWADKYKGKFDEGWDVMRERIFARQKALGWVPQETQLTTRPQSLAAWKDIPEDERPFQRRLMEVFAGMTEHADTHAGRLIDELESLGIRENTLVIYIWGDNGSSAEGQNGTISELLAQNGIPTQIKDHIRALDELGGLDVLGTNKVDNMYHAGWAWAGSTPFQGTKLTASYLGGTRTPMAVSWPKTIKPDAAIRTQFHHVNDIVPTIYDVVGIQPPKLVDGVTQEPLDGVSLRYTFADAKAVERKKTQYFEVMGSRAIYQDGWMASVFGPRTPWEPGLPPSIMSWSPEKDTWELYDLSSDYAQGKDLATANPQKVTDLKKVFDEQALANKVDPVGGGLWSILHPQYAPTNPATEFAYNQDVVGIPEFAGPKVGARSSLVTMEVDLKSDSSGVLYALGAISGGLALWVDKGKLSYEYNLFEIQRTRIESQGPLPEGKVKIEVESRMAEAKRASAMDVSIRVNGQEVAKGRVPVTASLAFTANDAFDVGIDSYSPVSLAYFDRAPFKFNGRIGQVNIRYL
ncbi:arylsulfatase [Variovorax dokdonensis]|uniref:Arylsulfatase n=1 Tax=Variovorax dokdonensis TaxID=344883 RepID=A0ABT7N9B2_9BURK|nr:arylsulfatase [Variovorax dokdonensis]MDM0044533.1 arylsulfatase [Variovorax dokdonensis]